jgi:hypothetical protein
VIQARIPKSFTSEKALASIRREYFELSSSSQDNLEVEVVHGDESHQGFIRVKAERGNYEQAKKAFAACAEYKDYDVAYIFDWYQLDHQA